MRIAHEEKKQRNEFDQIGRNKQSPDEVQFSRNKQRFQQHSLQKSKNLKKKVQFNCHTPSTKQRIFENGKYHLSGTLRSNKSISEDHNPISPSINVLSSNVPIVDDKLISSARATVVTFIIIILIILAAAIAVGVTIGMTNSQKSSSGTGTGNNNQNSGVAVSTMSTIVVVSSVSIGSQSGAPCTSYTTINDPTRSVNQTGIYGTCDNGPLFNASNGGSWIRFVGTGGTTIPLTSPGKHHCSGYVATWFNDTLPITVGTVVNGTVCFTLDGGSCILSVMISVVNCGGFYTYFLPPVPVCNARYCTI